MFIFARVFTTRFLTSKLHCQHAQLFLALFSQLNRNCIITPLQIQR